MADGMTFAISEWVLAHRDLRAAEDELVAAYTVIPLDECESRARHLVGCWRRMDRAKNNLWCAVMGVELPQRAVEGEE